MIRILFLSLLALCVHAKQHYLSLGDTPKYTQGFKHFEYVNPNAPKYGRLNLASIGGFDSLNPYLLKGDSAAGLGFLYDTLMSPSEDESLTYYALVAKAVEIAKDNKSVRFFLNEKAHFHDGKAISAQDVVFTFNTLRKYGTPFYKKYYKDVVLAKALDKHTVEFRFRSDKNRELPIILAQLPVLPKHFWQDKNFLKSSTITPLGSGPYKIKRYKFGKYIEYERAKNYWAKDLNTQKGRYNFNAIRYEYYRDQNVLLEAFKAGAYDFRMENSSKNWATQYSGKLFTNKTLVKEELEHERIKGMQAFVFNTRTKVLQDKAVRKAMNYLFDFEWLNKNLFYSQYTRQDSYFDNSFLESKAKVSLAERELLNKVGASKEVIEGVFKNPVTDASGNIRIASRKALQLLQKNGYKLQKGKLSKNGKALSFELLLGSASFERIVTPFQKNLKKIGIDMRIRVVDAVQYQERLQNFDYDMIIRTFRTSLSPGNELYNTFHSSSKDAKGSNNYIGVQDKVVDKLIDTIVTAPSKKELTVAVKALDRALLQGYYVIPQWYINTFRIAYKNKFAKPDVQAKYGLGLYNWWIDENKEKAL